MGAELAGRLPDINQARRIRSGKQNDAELGIRMIGTFARYLLLALVLAPVAASAEATSLKLSFFSSDRALLYTANVKPFVDKMNEVARGLLDITVYFSGAIGKSPAEQPQLVRDGVVDIAYIIPGYTPEQFPDTAVIELPGLFADQHEASMVYTRMVAANAMRGYEDFVVIGAFTSEPQSIHTRVPVATLADLRGKQIRTNNPIEAAAIERLGMKAMSLPINLTAEAISDGKIDGAMVSPPMMIEFGIGRMATYHYLLRTSAVPLTLVMNRKKFESLPPQTQSLILQYGGEWAVARADDMFRPIGDRVMAQLIADPRRTVISPSAADLAMARGAFQSVIDEWAARSPRNRELLTIAESEIARLRAGY
jgi:TRAP-type C4-dicarboxylate transport system substrate-binding protein